MAGAPEIDLEALARLAGLELSERERRDLQGEIARILEYVTRIAELELDDVPATRHGLPLEPTEREDRPAPGLDRSTVLDAAPETEDGYLRVPPVLPGE